MKQTTRHLADTANMSQSVDMFECKQVWRNPKNNTNLQKAINIGRKQITARADDIANI